MPYLVLDNFPQAICWVSLVASNKNNSDLFFEAEVEIIKNFSVIFFVLRVYTMRDTQSNYCLKATSDAS